MGKEYTHLTQEDRDTITIGLLDGKSKRAIGRILKRSPSTISRELCRNAPPIRTKYYLPHRAQGRAENRRHLASHRKRLKSPKIKAYVIRQLKRSWSPEMIAGRMRELGWKETISYEAIYQWVYTEARELIPYLPRGHRLRQKRGHSRKHRKAHIPGRIPIEERPKIVASRKRIGDWEADTIVSRKSKATLQLIVDRKTRFVILNWMPNRESATMRKMANKSMRQLPQAYRRTMTFDNGVENTEHQFINQVLGTRSYFCTPYTSQERGTVENRAGLVRWHFPKGMDFAKLSRRDVKQVERWLNNRPMKLLGYQTPSEVFHHGVALRG
jgi:IS30 family transposase